jgi:hypothetical protein
MELQHPFKEYKTENDGELPLAAFIPPFQNWSKPVVVYPEYTVDFSSENPG